MHTVLNGHTSFETGYLIPDYPYGSQLRCKRMVWVETKKGHGQRFVSCTTNPRNRNAETWNKPHPGIYVFLTVLYIDAADGHVHQGGLRLGVSLATFNEWVAKFDFVTLYADPATVRRLDLIEATARKNEETARKTAENKAAD